jgi:hypothetical protein
MEYGINVTLDSEAGEVPGVPEWKRPSELLQGADSPDRRRKYD